MAVRRFRETLCSVLHGGRPFRRERCRRCRGAPALLETRPAQNRPSLGRPERNRCLHPARRAVRSCFRPYPWTAIGALGLALLAVLGIVLEILVMEEELLACSKDEFGAAINTFQDLIREFHGRLPRRRELQTAMTSDAPVPFPSSYVVQQQGARAASDLGGFEFAPCPLPRDETIVHHHPTVRSIGHHEPITPADLCSTLAGNAWGAEFVRVIGICALHGGRNRHPMEKLPG
jgi:hypothetical protein